jgi:Cu-Zn family superoxide dismutase
MLSAGCAAGRPEAATAAERPEASRRSVEIALHDAHGDAVAAAVLTELEEGLAVVIRGRDLPPGPHGFHVHSRGLCEAPAFASAGGHFNPDSTRHGMDNPAGPHAGDLGNVVVRADGILDATVVAPRLSLADGPRSILREGGTALVLHAGVDDQRTDPAGDAGARIACGVIGQ